MTDTLRLAPALAVPLEYATDATAILGKRGSGKTNTAVVAVEEMVGAGIPTVVVDTVGVWWGLRSSASGAKAGLPVVVFGGEHGDVPLEEKSGQIIADAILDHGLSAVVDTSGLGKAAAKRFLLAFVTRIYHRKASDRTPLHVVFDEADELAPQSTSGGGPEGPMLLSAMEDFVRRGRSRGLGCTLVTQRPAVLNKDVLTQVEILIAMRMTGPRDVAAIDEWVKLHAEPEVALKVKHTLAAIPTGTGWVWSPDFLNILEQVKFRARRTFDSSATPKIGEVRVEPKARAEVDLAQLGEQIAATVEKAKADDPKALRARIADLEKQLAAARAETPDPVEVEVPILTDEDRFTAQRMIDSLAELGKQLSESLPTAQQLVDHWSNVLGPRSPLSPGLTAKVVEFKAEKAARRVVPAKAVTEVALTEPTPRRTVTEPGRLGKAERAVLSVLVQRGAQSDRQIATLSGYTAKGGGFRNALGALRSAGLIVGSKDHIEITADGVETLGPVEPLPSGQALVDYWLTHRMLGKAERLILGALVDAYPDGITQDDVAVQTGYEPGGGGFRNAVGKLRSLELIHGTRDGLFVMAEIGEARDA